MMEQDTATKGIFEVQELRGGEPFQAHPRLGISFLLKRSRFGYYWLIAQLAKPQELTPAARAKRSTLATMPIRGVVSKTLTDDIKRSLGFSSRSEYILNGISAKPLQPTARR
jgi:hypothetical protein